MQIYEDPLLNLLSPSYAVPRRPASPASSPTFMGFYSMTFGTYHN